VPKAFILFLVCIGLLVSCKTTDNSVIDPGIGIIDAGGGYADASGAHSQDAIDSINDASDLVAETGGREEGRTSSASAEVAAIGDSGASIEELIRESLGLVRSSKDNIRKYLEEIDKGGGGSVQRADPP